MPPSKQQRRQPHPQAKPTPNTFGSDLWIRNPQQQQRRATSGRGLFAGLQDVKNYNVDQGWARRQSTDASPAGESTGSGGGFFGVLGRWVWGS